MIDFHFLLETGNPPREVMVSDRVQPNYQWPGNRKLSVNAAALGPFIFFRAPYGFWDRVYETATLGSGPVQVIFPKIEPTSALPWWHQLHGIKAPQTTSNYTMRIGVIDEALAPQAPISCIAHVHNLGAEAWASKTTPRALTPITLHGHAVCSLIGSRADPTRGFAGVFPEAELYFASAARDNNERISISRLNACIDLLVDKYACDIISISAGDFDSPLTTVEEMVKSAGDRGTLCFFAAGNEGKALFPASQPECLAVAAIGQTGFAPQGTNVALADLAQSETIVDPVYLWSKSGRGPDIEFCAPGVGVVWNVDRCAAKPGIGTSYACPIAAGIAGRILASQGVYKTARRTRQRVIIAMQALVAACQPFGSRNEHLHWKYGRFVVS